MIQRSLRALSMVIIAGVGGVVGAQALPEALQLLPSNAVSVEVYRNLALSESRWGQLQGRIGKPGDALEPFLAALPMSLPGLAQGPVLVGTFPGAEGKPEAKLYLLPLKQFEVFLKGMHAVKAGGLWRVSRKQTAFYLSRQGAFALLSTEADLVKKASGTPDDLGEELGPLVPWLASHDLAVVIPSAVIKAAFAGISQLDKDKKAAPGMEGIMGMVKPFLAETGASVSQAGLALDLPEDGSARMQARVFFVPGSPLAQSLGALPASQGHPMEGLPAEGFVLGGGGPVPQALSQWTHTLITAVLAATPGDKDPAQTAQMMAVQAEMAKQVRSMSFSLGVPAQPGEPLLGNVKARMQVEDPGKYMDLLEENGKVSSSLLAAKGLAFTTERSSVAGVPSLTLTETFGAEGKSPLPIQAKGIMTLLLGTSDHLAFTYGQVDEHTLVGVLGGVKELKDSLASFAPGFAAQPGVAAIDALLPAGAPWRFYLDLQGARNLIQMGKDLIAPGQGAAFPALPATPPLGLAVTVDASGAELSAAVTSQTIGALSGFIQGFKGLFPEQPAPAAKAKKKAPKHY